MKKKGYSILAIDDEIGGIQTLYQDVTGYKIYPTKGQIQKMQNKLNVLSDIVEYVCDYIDNNYTRLRCIVCDLTLVPDNHYDGTALIEAIRENCQVEGYPYYNRLLPIIAYTQNRDFEILAKALEKGATVALVKSVDIKYLRAVINKQIKDFNIICDEFVLANKSKDLSQNAFKVSLTFNGKDTREFVRSVADLLAIEFSKHKVFFDEYHEELIIGKGADNKLKDIYCSQSDFIVPFFSENYENGTWSGNVEWSSIKETLNQKKDRLIPVMFKMVNIDGLDLKKDIVISVSQDPPRQNLSPEEVAERIINVIKKK